MKLSTQEKCRYDVLQYQADDVFAVRSMTFAGGLPQAVQSGSAIDGTGALVTALSTEAYIVADGQPQGTGYCVVFDKLVNLISAEIKGADASGTSKALEILSADPFIRLV